MAEKGKQHSLGTKETRETKMYTTLCTERQITEHTCNCVYAAVLVAAMFILSFCVFFFHSVVRSSTAQCQNIAAAFPYMHSIRRGIVSFELHTTTAAATATSYFYDFWI